MSEPTLDVIALGNALVDVIAHAEDGFLAEHGLVKGSMRLIDDEMAERLYASMGPGVESSGGSAANTVAGVASLGARAGYVGKVGDDQLGAVFAHDLRALDVAFDVAPAAGGSSTGRCLIVVTPDAQRTMNTYLGVAGQLGPDDIDEAFIGRAKVTYCEGYLWDVDVAKHAITRAMKAAHAAGRTVALTLSDGFCVDRHRSEFLHLVEGHVDVLFANEEEICSLYEVAAFDEALQRVRGHCELAFLTRGAAGSVVVAGDEVHVIAAHPVARVVDTTGAGDLYAAGALFGLTGGHDLSTCGRLASAAAGEVISHIGARPESPLVRLAESVLAADAGH